MFGAGLPKLILFALVIYVTWKAFNAIVRMGAAQRGAVPPRQAPRAAGPRAAGAARAPMADAVDLVKCPVCSAYVSSASLKSCGRPDCLQTR